MRNDGGPLDHGTPSTLPPCRPLRIPLSFSISLDIPGEPRLNVPPDRRASWIESAAGPIASWLHLPAGAEPRPEGVVICPPMGHEYTHSYRTLLHLADRLAEAGIPALRFDYHGSGSSPGDALSPDLLSRWVDDVHAAASVLADLTGRPATLVGLRLGATLAGLAASRFDVRHLVAWVPVVQGRRYVREREALGKIAGATRREGADYLEAGGFILADRTAEELRAVDLTKLGYRIRGDALVLDRDDMKTPTAFPEALRAQGIDVDVIEAPGYLEMMDEPHYTVVPHEVIGRITGWLADRIGDGTVGLEDDGSGGPAGDGRAAITVRPAGEDDEGSAGTEELVQLEGSPSLFGVLTRPSGVPPGDRPLLILSNAGSVHSVGPNRVYVELARALAAVGFASLRFDLRNLGDSIRGSTPDENHPYPETAMEDTARMIEWATEQRGFERVVLGGVCSGAYTAFRCGVGLSADPLAGVLPINPLTFHWYSGLSLDIPPAYQTIREAKYYESAIRDPERWRRLFRGQVDVRNAAGFVLRRAKGIASEAVRDLLESLRLRRPSRLARELLAYPESGTRLDFVFSRSDPGHGILTSEARRTVRRLQRSGAVTVSFIEEADHTFSRADWRRELESLVIDRLRGYES